MGAQHSWKNAQTALIGLCYFSTLQCYFLPVLFFFAVAVAVASMVAISSSELLSVLFLRLFQLLAPTDLLDV